MNPPEPNHQTKRLRPTEPKSISVRLIKHQQDLNRLRLKLNSYATKTRKENCALEQIVSLQKSVEILSYDNLTILASLKEQKASRGDYLECVAKQFSEFHKLRRSVNEYAKGIEPSSATKAKAMTDTVQFFGTFQSESVRLWSKFSTSMNAFFLLRKTTTNHQTTKYSAIVLLPLKAWCPKFGAIKRR